jgi:methylglutaconyl-CoA hydratase
MSLTPDEWQTAEWAKQHNLLQEVFDTIDQVDQYIESLIQRWNSYSPDAMAELKKIFWEGTQHWDTLLSERAAISGKLVLSEFTRQAIAKFKSS